MVRYQAHECIDTLGILIFLPADDLSVAEGGDHAHDAINGFAALSVQERIVDLRAQAAIAGKNSAQREAPDLEIADESLKPPADAIVPVEDDFLRREHDQPGLGIEVECGSLDVFQGNGSDQGLDHAFFICIQNDWAFTNLLKKCGVKSMRASLARIQVVGSLRG